MLARWGVGRRPAPGRRRSAAGWRRRGRDRPDRSDWPSASSPVRGPKGPHRAFAPPLSQSLGPVLLNWLLIDKPVARNHGHMTHWISRLANRLADLYYPPTPFVAVR